MQNAAAAGAANATFAGTTDTTTTTPAPRSGIIGSGLGGGGHDSSMWLHRRGDSDILDGSGGSVGGLSLDGGFSRGFSLDGEDSGKGLLDRSLKRPIQSRSSRTEGDRIGTRRSYARSEDVVDGHVVELEVPRRRASQQLMDLLLDVDRPPDRLPAPPRSTSSLHRRDSFWDRDGGWNNPNAEWTALPAQAPPTLGAPHSGDYEAEQAQHLIGGFSKALRGKWVDPDADRYFASDDSWAQLVDEEGGGGGGRGAAVVAARFSSSALLMADVAEGRQQRPLVGAVTVAARNGRTLSLANSSTASRGVHGDGSEDDDWMRHMKLQVEARAAAKRQGV